MGVFASVFHNELQVFVVANLFHESFLDFLSGPVHCTPTSHFGEAIWCGSSIAEEMGELVDELLTPNS